MAFHLVVIQVEDYIVKLGEAERDIAEAQAQVVYLQASLETANEEANTVRWRHDLGQHLYDSIPKKGQNTFKHGIATTTFETRLSS